MCWKKKKKQGTINKMYIYSDCQILNTQASSVKTENDQVKLKEIANFCFHYKFILSQLYHIYVI